MTHLMEVLEHCNREYYLSINHDPMKVTECLRWEIRLTIENNDGLTKKYRVCDATLEKACKGIADAVVAEVFGDDHE